MTEKAGPPPKELPSPIARSLSAATDELLCLLPQRHEHTPVQSPLLMFVCERQHET